MKFRVDFFCDSLRLLTPRYCFEAAQNWDYDIVGIKFHLAGNSTIGSLLSPSQIPFWLGILCELRHAHERIILQVVCLDENRKHSSNDMAKLGFLPTQLTKSAPYSNRRFNAPAFYLLFRVKTAGIRSIISCMIENWFTRKSNYYLCGRFRGVLSSEGNKVF